MHIVTCLSDLALPADLMPSSLALAWLALVAAYLIFALVGFGTALVAGPVLALFLPLATIVPLLALLDFSAASLTLARHRRAAVLPELQRLVPGMLAGSLIGAALLLLGAPGALQLALGLFAIGQALLALSGRRPARQLPPGAALPFGFIGGIFSALFGSGGFLYAIYLGARLETAEQIRVTQSVLIGLSTLTRAVIFLGAGVYFNATLLWLAVVSLPAMLIGLALGRRIALRLDRAQFLRLVNAVVLLSGLVLVARQLSR